MGEVMNSLDLNGLTEKQFLEQYDPGKYQRPSVAVDMIIFTVADVQCDNYRKLPEKELRVLLIRRGGHPYIGRWALPGGFVNPSETVGEAARRELMEETGIQDAYLEQLYTFSNPGRDPRTWVISCAHMALIDSSQIKLRAGSDADDVRWFTVRFKQDKLSLSNDDIVLSENGLAFDHAEIIICAINRLRAKLEYTDLAFCLMPEKFTLTELQQVYETILGKPLYKAAFRRKIVDLVWKTDQYTSDKGHRPAIIYTKKE